MLRYAVILCVLLVAPSASAKVVLDDYEWRFLELINAYRAANGLPCLTPSPTLNAAAEFHSEEMGRKNFFSHNEPPCAPPAPGDVTRRDCTGRSPGPRIMSFGHPSKFTGENIYAGQLDHATAEFAFVSWRDSPPHNANMLRPEFKAIGIARVHVPGSSLHNYWTNTFSDTVDGRFEACGGERGAGGNVPPWVHDPRGSFDPYPHDGSSEDEPEPEPKEGGGSDDSDKGGCSAAGGGASALIIAALWLRRRARL